MYSRPFGVALIFMVACVRLAHSEEAPQPTAVDAIKASMEPLAAPAAPLPASTPGQPRILGKGVIHFPPRTAAEPGNGVLYIAEDQDVTAYQVDDSTHSHELFTLKVGSRVTLDLVGTVLHLKLPQQNAVLYDVSDPRRPTYLGFASRSPSPSLGSPPALPPKLGLPPDPLHGVMFNAKLGFSGEAWPTPSFSLTSSSAEYRLSLALEGGYAINRARNLYLLLSLQGELANPSRVEAWQTFLLAMGLQRDIAIPAIRGLYIYPRLLVGYARLIETTRWSHFAPGIDVYNGGLIVPELGLKYRIPGSPSRFHCGVDLFSLPIMFAEKKSIFADPGYEVWIRYRLLFYVGVNL